MWGWPATLCFLNPSLSCPLSCPAFPQEPNLPTLGSLRPVSGSVAGPGPWRRYERKIDGQSVVLHVTRLMGLGLGIRDGE
jgi:hypothetical protein